MSNTTDDDVHWEDIIRILLDRLGMDGFYEAVTYVLDERTADYVLPIEEPTTVH